MENKKNKSNIKSTVLNIALFIITVILFGSLIEYLAGGILKDFFEQYIHSDKLYIDMLNMFLMLIIFIIGYSFHIIVHEAGHLVFGLLSGYEFISYRIGSFIVIKEDGKLKFKRYNIPGTGGQCLMMPPKKSNGNFPFILYNLGGVLANIIISLITILIAFFLKKFIFIHGVLIIISGAGLLVAITNGIPLKIGGISNDGHNIMTMIQDNDSKESFYLQLKTHGLLSQGIRMRDMPFEQFQLKENIDYKNPLNFSRIFMNYNYHLDNMDFEQAEDTLNFGKKHVHKTIGLYQNEIDSELLFLELIGKCNIDKIETLYSKKLKKYIKASKFLMDKQRIMMAYELFYKKDNNKALKHFKSLAKLGKNYPIKGEAYMEIMLGNFLKDQISYVENED